MLALSFGLLLVMGTVALLLADMERKRRIIVDLFNLCRWWRAAVASLWPTCGVSVAVRYKPTA